MLTPFAAALVVAMAAQLPSSDRSRAEQLARDGHTVEAIELFERIAEQQPSDTESRLWIARLKLRLGDVDEAEAGFRSVIREHPEDVDARIGLGAALTRKDAWRDAIDVLEGTMRDAGENADLFATLARAYRRSGDDRRALEYFARAKALAPADRDVAAGYEGAAQSYGHSLAFDGFGEHGTGDTNAESGTLVASLRVSSPLHVLGSARVQQRSGSSDTLLGVGVFWRAHRALTVEARGAGGSGNTSLPTSELTAGIVGYIGAFELGGDLRRLAFSGVNVVATSPTVSWDRGGRSRIDSRYTYSRSTFTDSGRSSGDHSVMLRETWRAWSRVSLMATYAYGIESFEQLTADRLGSLGATTAAAGLRITCPSLSTVTATWEHQWRSNDTAVDRVIVSFVQVFP